MDNNPLVFFALALVVMAAINRPAAEGKPGINGRSHCLSAVMAGFIIFIMWPLAHYLTLNVVDSTQAWPEVRHLAEARVMSGVRWHACQMIQTVRSFADPARHDTVLLLPNDPNVEAWFERDRPQFSCAIIFTDQYWERYVDRDCANLQAHPPKVIVIGPRNYWRFFCRGWHVNGAAERLIDLVQQKMLASDYELKSAQEIAYQGGTDFMDIYVRRNEQ